MHSIGRHREQLYGEPNDAAARFHDTSPSAVPHESPEHMIHRIVDNALTEFRMMMDMLGESASALDFASLEQCALTSLSEPVNNSV